MDMDIKWLTKSSQFYLLVFIFIVLFIYWITRGRGYKSYKRIRDYMKKLN
jgi:hypothetical protein